MRNLKRALAAVFVLLLAAVVLFFVLENQQTVSLVLLGCPGHAGRRAGSGRPGHWPGSRSAAGCLRRAAQQAQDQGFCPSGSIER